MAQDRKEEARIAAALIIGTMKDLSYARETSLINHVYRLKETLRSWEYKEPNLEDQQLSNNSLRQELDSYETAPRAPEGLDQALFNECWKTANPQEETELRRIRDLLDTLDRKILEKCIVKLSAEVVELQRKILNTRTINLPELNAIQAQYQRLQAQIDSTSTNQPLQEQLTIIKLALGTIDKLKKNVFTKKAESLQDNLLTLKYKPYQADYLEERETDIQRLKDLISTLKTLHAKGDKQEEAILQKIDNEVNGLQRLIDLSRKFTDAAKPIPYKTAEQQLRAQVIVTEKRLQQSNTLSELQNKCLSLHERLKIEVLSLTDARKQLDDLKEEIQCFEETISCSGTDWNKRLSKLTKNLEILDALVEKIAPPSASRPYESIGDESPRDIMPTINEDHAIIMATALAEDLDTLLKKGRTITAVELDLVESRLTEVRQMAPTSDQWTRVLGNLKNSITLLKESYTRNLNEETPLFNRSSDRHHYYGSLSHRYRLPPEEEPLTALPPEKPLTALLPEKPLTALELGKKLVDAAATAEAARAAAREARAAAETPAATVSRNVRGGT